MKKSIKSIFNAYIKLSALFGFAVVSWVACQAVLYKHCYSAVPYNIVVHLDNGFIYNLDNWHDDHRFVGDENGNVIVKKDVYGLMTEGKTIYGPRKERVVGGDDKRYFFICTYGEDCSQNQHYQETEFQEELKRRGLPPFDWKAMKNRHELMAWEWSKHSFISGTACYLYF